MLGALGKRLVAYVVLFAAALLALKLLAGALIGLATMAVSLVMAVALGVGAIWAYRRLS